MMGTHPRPWVGNMKLYDYLTREEREKAANAVEAALLAELDLEDKDKMQKEAQKKEKKKKKKRGQSAAVSASTPQAAAGGSAPPAVATLKPLDNAFCMPNQTLKTLIHDYIHKRRPAVARRAARRNILAAIDSYSSRRRRSNLDCRPFSEHRERESAY